MQTRSSGPRCVSLEGRAAASTGNSQASAPLASPQTTGARPPALGPSPLADVSSKAKHLNARHLGWCPCPQMTMSQRQAIIREVPGQCSAKFPPAETRPLVLHDMDAGQLWQLVGLVNGLLDEGYRAMTLNVKDPHYPPEACGEHHFSGRGAHQHNRAVEAGGRLYLSGPFGAHENVLAMLEREARNAVYALLAHVGSLVGASAGALTIDVNVYRRTQVLAARIASGMAPRSHLVLGIDLANALGCPAAEANCVFIRHRRGLETAIWHPDCEPLTFHIGPGNNGGTRVPVIVNLAALIEQHRERYALVRAVERDPKLGVAVWADWPALRFSAAVGAAARGDALAVAAPRSLGQQLRKGPGMMDDFTDVSSHRGYGPTLDRVSDLSMVVDAMIGRNWTITFDSCNAAGSERRAS